MILKVLSVETTATKTLCARIEETDSPRTISRIYTDATWLRELCQPGRFIEIRDYPMPLEGTEIVSFQKK